MALTVEAFAEDCARAAVVVSAREAARRLRGGANRSQNLARAARPRCAGSAIDSRKLTRSRLAMTGPGAGCRRRGRAAANANGAA